MAKEWVTVKRSEVAIQEIFRQMSLLFVLDANGYDFHLYCTIVFVFA